MVIFHQNILALVQQGDNVVMHAGLMTLSSYSDN